MKKGPLAELTLQQSLELFNAMRAHDSNVEPKLEEPTLRGMSADYAGIETKRIVDLVQGKCAVIPSIGVDVPNNIHVGVQNGPNQKTFSSAPETLHTAVAKAFEAGAGGILISREYDEKRVENLKAIGDALRELGKV